MNVEKEQEMYLPQTVTTETQFEETGYNEPNVENTTDSKTDVEEEPTEIKVKKLDLNLLYSLMAVPTASNFEYRMAIWIMLFAKANNIKYETDDYGNLYLTKGELEEGENYPCVTAHLDTVQTKQEYFASAGAKLNVKTTIKDGQHKIYVDNFGIGGDDKAGLCICLNMFSYTDKLKACFFLEEELLDVGSSHLKKEWFDNVGYVLGFDSPDLNRAAYQCQGYRLMSKDFFVSNGLDEICKQHGLNDFRAEPITDVVEIRKQTEVVCMNFGSGYYNCHTDKEYCIIEDMDEALCLGYDIIQKLGCTRHRMKCHATSYYAYDDDAEYFESLNPKNAYRNTATYKNQNNNVGYQNYNSGYTQSYSSVTTTQTEIPKEEKNEINFEIVSYISEVYEDRLLDIENSVKEKCKELNIDFNEHFANLFNTEITF